MRRCYECVYCQPFLQNGASLYTKDELAEPAIPKFRQVFCLKAGYFDQEGRLTFTFLTEPAQRACRQHYQREEKKSLEEKIIFFKAYGVNLNKTLYPAKQIFPNCQNTQPYV